MIKEDIGNDFLKSHGWFFISCLLVGFGVYSFFSITLSSPMLASDEYAYLISGKYLHNLNDIYKFDPYLQQVSNLLYFKIISVVNHFFGSQLVLSLRLLHLIEYFASALVLYKALEGFFDKKSLLLGCIAFLFFPGAMYIYTIMPEIELILLGSCFAYVTLQLFPRTNIVGCVLAGGIISLAIMIKPHAVALLLTGLATVFIYPFFSREDGYQKNFSRAILNSFVLLISAYVVFIAIWRICSSAWSFDPRDPLGLSFYGRYLVANPVSIVDKLVGVFKYVTVNLIVLYLIFAPVLYWLARSFVESFNKDNNFSAANKLTTVFFITLILSHVLMISYFTFNAGLRNDGESMRIHGRYLGVVLVALTFLYFGSLDKVTRYSSRVFALSVFANTLLFIFIIRFFKIFPWDYPLLFGFFDVHNFYSWGFDGCLKFIKGVLLLFILFGSILIFFKKNLFKKVLGFQLVFVFLFASIQTHAWLFSHLKSNEKTSSTGKALKMMFMSDVPGKGVLGTNANDRYGQSSYLLFNIANAPKVILKTSDSVFDSADVTDSDWVLLPDSYPAKFDYKNKININGFNFYLVNSPISIIQPKLKTMEKGEKVRILLGRAQGSNVQLIGFNEVEEWGGWSSEENAEIQLPFEINGNVKLQIFGWVIEENQNTQVKIDIGNFVTSVPFTKSGAMHEINLQLNHPTNKIGIHSSIARPAGSHRNMGVAISYLIIENTP